MQPGTGGTAGLAARHGPNPTSSAAGIGKPRAARWAAVCETVGTGANHHCVEALPSRAAARVTSRKSCFARRRHRRCQRNAYDLEQRETAPRARGDDAGGLVSKFLFGGPVAGPRDARVPDHRRGREPVLDKRGRGRHFGFPWFPLRPVTAEPIRPAPNVSAPAGWTGRSCAPASDRSAGSLVPSASDLGHVADG